MQAFNALRNKPSVAIGIVVALLAVAIALLVALRPSDATAQIRAQVFDDVNALADLSPTTVGRLFPGDDVAALQRAGVDPASFYRTLFDGVQCTVDGVDVAGDAAVVHMHVTGRDLARAFDSYRAGLAGRLATRDGRDELASLGDDQAVRLGVEDFVAAVESAPDAYVTTRLDLAYVRSGSAWVASDPTALGTALLGGLDPVVALRDAPSVPDAADVQTDSPHSSVVATVDDDGYATYVG